MRALVVVMVLAATPIAAAEPRRGFDPATVYRVPRGTAPADGPADAPVTIVAWSDYACGYCNRVQHTLDQLARLYPGQLRWVHRSLPLDDDNTLPLEAALAAAAQGKFRPMNDRLYAAGGRVDRAGIELIARQLGLDLVRLRDALDRHSYRAQIEADVADARALGITGTPAFFVNGRAIHGNLPLRVFAEVVDEELARAARDGGDYDALVARGQPMADTPGATRPRGELEPERTYRVGLGLPGHRLGPDTAPVTIVVWGDFQCPYCARMAPVLAHARTKYGDDVRIIYRHLAMAMHRHAALAAEAGVEAAIQGKFWAFHDQVFGQGQGPGKLGALARPDLERLAAAAGVDVAKLRAALDDRRHRDAVAAETAGALALGVDGTPTMFINGRPVVGSRDEAGLDKVIDEQLARAKGAIAGGVAPGDVYALVMSDASGDERADPLQVPTSSAAHAALRADDRARAVAAACRRRDPAQAAELAAGLAAPARRHALLVCTAVGIDLPAQ